jgi:hypothetical protein
VDTSGTYALDVIRVSFDRVDMDANNLGVDETKILGGGPNGNGMV